MLQANFRRTWEKVNFNSEKLSFISLKNAIVSRMKVDKDAFYAYQSSLKSMIDKIQKRFEFFLDVFVS